MPLPPGYHISEGGQVESQNEMFGAIITALGVAVLLMYLILVVQFGSFLEPLAILISLPLSLIGVVLALLVTGDTLNVMSLIGVMMLMGIVAKNAILLIDFAKWSHTRWRAERARCADRGRSHPPAADHDDDAGPHRRHDPRGARRTARVPTSAHRWAARSSAASSPRPCSRCVVIPTVYEIMEHWRSTLLKRLGGGTAAVQREYLPTPTHAD